MTATTISVVQGTDIYIHEVNGTISYSTDKSNWIGINFPCTIVNNTVSTTTFVKVLFDDITISNDNQYFICGSNYIQFGSKTLNSNGKRPVITVNTNYGGLINNGLTGNANGKNFIYIFNLFVNGIVNGTIKETTFEGGWITRKYFNGNNIKIINCSSNGNIQQFGGGILSYRNKFSGEVIGCSSSGEIISEGGGITGHMGYSSYTQNLSISFCFSSGNINNRSGGILGLGVSYGSQITINNCYSIGEIFHGNGIGGEKFGTRYINNCYTIGTIGVLSGGIGDGYNNNCYTTGSIAGGGVASQYNTPKEMKNIYVAGQLSDPLIGEGFFIGKDAGGEFPNCYSEAYNNSAGWNDLHAKSVLIGVATTVVPTDTDIWVSSNTNTNTPFHFAYMGYTPYSTEIINDNNELVRTFSYSIKQGEKTKPALISSRSYTILGISGENTNPYDSITINDITGEISTTSSTFPGTYTIYISSKDETETTIYYTKYLLTVVSLIYLKKNKYGDHSCSSRLLRLKNKNINKVKTSYENGYYVKNTNEQNTINHALFRTRAGGYMVPPKITKK